MSKVMRGALLDMTMCEPNPFSPDHGRQTWESASLEAVRTSPRRRAAA